MGRERRIELYNESNRKLGPNEKSGRKTEVQEGYESHIVLSTVCLLVYDSLKVR